MPRVKFAVLAIEFDVLDRRTNLADPEVLHMVGAEPFRTVKNPCVVAFVVNPWLLGGCHQGATETERDDQPFHIG